ncbi:MAG: hypothetical protein ACFE89_02525 [Candidatus Hodarchaeota archaeon]
MAVEEQTFLIQVECYDALGYYEENGKRILLVMESIGDAKTVKQDWVRAQAVGGSWVRALRISFETYVKPIQVKKWMVGLEYRPITELPNSLRHLAEKEGLFRFADIDVIELMGGTEPGAVRRLASRLGMGKRKVEKADLSHDARSPQFITQCRTDLIKTLEDPIREKLLAVEAKIFKQLKEKPPTQTR